MSVHNNLCTCGSRPVDLDSAGSIEWRCANGADRTDERAVRYVCLRIGMIIRPQTYMYMYMCEAKLGKMVCGMIHMGWTRYT